MRLFDSLLRKKVIPPGPTANDSGLIRFFDQSGAEVFVTKEQWRTSILPASLKSHWEDPEALYGIVVLALQDDFAADVLDAAEHLHRVDPLPSRGACVFGIALIKTRQLDKAEQIFRTYLEHHGEDGTVLTNLAQIYSARNDAERAEATLWHALEVDPNQDNGLSWYAVIHRERSGKEAEVEAWRRVAAIPGSWRAQLWLARAALESRNRERGMAYYHESMSQVGDNIPADFLMQMTGDLGQHGLLPELLEFSEPRFDPAIHGLQVGNNLIKANLELGRFDAARKILNQLRLLKRPDWNQSLSFWDTEITRAQIANLR